MTNSRQVSLSPSTDLMSSVDIVGLLQIIGIDQRTKERGQLLAGILAEHGHAIFAEFYRKIGKISSGYTFAPGQLDRLRESQIAHWRRLLSGNLDRTYVRNAAMVGEVHKRHGIEPLIYIVGYSVVKTIFMEIIAEKELPPASKGHLVMALERFISLDMGLAMVGYSGGEEYARLFSPATRN